MSVPRGSNNSINANDIQKVNDYDFSLNNPSFLHEVAARKVKRPNRKNYSNNRYNDILKGTNSALAERHNQI